MKLAHLALVASLTDINLAQAHHDDNEYSPEVPASVIQRFIDQDALRDDWEPVLREVSKGSKSFEIGGITVDKSDLIPDTDIFTSDATITVDGVQKTPRILVYKSKRHHDEIRAVLDDDKELVRASLRRHNGDEVDLVAIEGTTFAEIDADRDIDIKKLEGLEVVSPKHPPSA